MYKMYSVEQQMNYIPFLYDSSEPSNCEAWKRLPLFFQDYITRLQCSMQLQIKKALENEFRLIKFTSAFRSPFINKKCGGVSDSLHLHGLAVDFVFLKPLGKVKFMEKLKEIPRSLTESFQIFYENNHYHCQFWRDL